MVASEQVEAVRQQVLGSVSEDVGRAARNDAHLQEVREVSIPGNFAEADDDLDARQSLKFRREMPGAGSDLLGGRLVTRRSAADDGGDPGMAELQTIVDRDGTSFVGKAELMQDRIHEVAGAIAGEDAAGSIGAMGSRSKPKDENAGAWVTESRHRPGPVGLVH